MVAPALSSKQQFLSRLRLSPKELGIIVAHADALDAELKSRTPGFAFTTAASFMQVVAFLSRCYNRSKCSDARALLRIATASVSSRRTTMSRSISIALQSWRTCRNAAFCVPSSRGRQRAYCLSYQTPAQSRSDAAATRSRRHDLRRIRGRLQRQQLLHPPVPQGIRHSSERISQGRTSDIAGMAVSDEKLRKDCRTPCRRLPLSLGFPDRIPISCEIFCPHPDKGPGGVEIGEVPEAGRR